MKYLSLCALSFFYIALLFSGANASHRQKSLADNAGKEVGKYQFRTPRQTLDTLIHAILTGNLSLYELVVNRPLEEAELAHIDYIKKNPQKRILEIKSLMVRGREFKRIDRNRALCINQEVLVSLANGRKNRRKLETCFKKQRGRWVYLADDIRLFQ